MKNNSYTTYRIGNINRGSAKSSYTREELETLDASQLREILQYENIKTPSNEVLEDKEQMTEIILRYRGGASDIYISEFDEDKVAIIEKMLDPNSPMAVDQGGGNIQMPARMRIYKGIDSLYGRGEEFNITSTRNQLKETHAFLMDRANKIVAILRVTPGERRGDYKLTLPGGLISPRLEAGNYSNYSLVFIQNFSLKEIIEAYNSVSEERRRVKAPFYYRVFITEVIVEDVPDTEDVLVIDYGTSSTTVATFKDRIHRIIFQNSEKCEVNSENNTGVLCQECGKCYLCPGVVAVKHCGRDGVEFIFGYNANAEAKKRGYIAKNTIFYDTKRWVNSYEDLIEVVDFNGNSGKIQKKVIVREFLLHVIKTAEQQNKVRYNKLYFTCPVKQRGLFMKMFKDVLPDYRVIQDGILDEGMAVVYDKSISAKVAAGQAGFADDGGETSVLIIDCGGGTTDMVKCDYSLQRRNEITTKINISVGYAHGDTNFGGNNLTYRILQLLKIKLAEYYSGTQPVPINTLFDGVVQDVYGFVDEHGIKQAYVDFLKRYEWAENIIPTAFANYESSIEANYLRIRGNYFFLWNLAETLKKEFFNKSTYQYSFNRPRLSARKNSGSKHYLEVFNISVKKQNGLLELHTEYPDAEITRDEIYTVLRPDIYNLIKSFIEPYYETGSLEEIGGIFLSGQTSKIDIFREVLKEYIPGRKAKADTTNSYAKKLWCVTGAAAYQSSKELGQISPDLSFISPIVPYNLTADIFQGQQNERQLIRSGQFLAEIYAYISRQMTAEKVEFTLKDKDNAILNKYMFRIDTNSYGRMTYEELIDEYPMLQGRQADIDDIADREVRIFVFSASDDWGFNTLEVARSGGHIFCGELRYFPFENEQWEQNFFDGSK